jgi:hypothetical protein
MTARAYQSKLAGGCKSHSHKTLGRPAGETSVLEQALQNYMRAVLLRHRNNFVFLGLKKTPINKPIAS